MTSIVTSAMMSIIRKIISRSTMVGWFHSALMGYGAANAPKGYSPTMVILLLLAGGAAQAAGASRAELFWGDGDMDTENGSPPTIEERAQVIVDKMTDEELYAQTLMFGWSGESPSPLLYQWVERGLGSVKLFGWNTEDLEKVAKSVASLQKLASKNRFGIPLFVATDQEGGSIRHVKGSTTITPGPMALGASAYPIDAWKTGYYIAREIKSLGINMNFAPSIDLFTNHESQIIGPRSFGDDPMTASALGVAFAGGMQKAGVIPCAKHFPGHGDTDQDSHIFMPEINIDADTFRRRELVPFREMATASRAWPVSAMMSAHLNFPQIEGRGIPTSLSHYFLTDLLRGELGFDGLIITDDLMMNGDTLYALSLSNAFRLAMEAGNDILISSTTAKLDEPLWTNNLRLMQTSSAFKKRVKEAALRIVIAKLRYFRDDNAAPLYPEIPAIADHIPDKEGEAFFLDMACRSITAVKGQSLDANEAGRVLLVGGLADFFKYGRERYGNNGVYRFSFDAGPNETQYMCDHILENAQGYDTIICLVSGQSSRRIARMLQKQADKGKRVVIMSIMSPEYAIDMTWAETILLGYGWSGYTMKAMFGALAGDYEPMGRLPYKRG